ATTGSPNGTNYSPSTGYSPTTGVPLTTSRGDGGLSAPLPGAASTKAGGLSGMGMPFMPMGAGGQGNEERSQENGTWLHEEDDVWGGETDGVVNHRIG
ncbi:hypothetical protein, partial [Nonomuraea rhizosphaerae]|uniref:hypothetical protein n=1 Tax=Nonomuraea rhizosphaerae TaxID=2665663 RepID=UPI001C5EA0E9